MAVTGDRYPTDANPFDDIVIMLFAERLGLLRGLSSGVPDVSRYLTVTTSVGVTYRLFPNCRNHRSNPTVVYYAAYNVNARRVDYAVGPRFVQRFDSRSTLFVAAAGNFFGFTGHVSDYEVTSAMVGYFVMRGEFGRAFRALGQSWLQALQSPDWWAVAAPASAAALPRTPRPAAPRNPSGTNRSSGSGGSGGSGGQHRPPNSPPPPAAGNTPPLTPALARLHRTRANRLNAHVERTSYVLDRPQTFRHTVTGDIPEVSVLRIQQSGQMRLSRGANAHYGEGVYAWSAGQTNVGRYIDIQVPAGTAVERLVVHGSRGQQVFYRLVPGQGSTLPVRVQGTSFTSAQLDRFRPLIED